MYFAYITLVVALANNVIAGHSQFYYSAPRAIHQQYYTPPAPVQQYYTPAQQYYQNTAPQPYYQRQPQQQYYQRQAPQPYYQNQAPVFYQRAYTPVQQYVVPQVFRQQTFGYQHTTPLQFIQHQHQPQYQQQQQQEAPVQVQANSNFNTQSRINAMPEAAAEESKTSDESSQSDNFRGFAYHTEYENGGRSNVVFLQGPELSRYRSALKANLTNSQQFNIRTSASDSIDTNAEEVKPQQPSQSFEALVNFLENPQSGVQRFYSVNNALVARNLNDEISNFPASTLPLRQPISPLFPLLSSRFNLGENVAETTTVQATSQAATTEDSSSANALSIEEHEGSASEARTIEINNEHSSTTAIVPAVSTTTSTEIPSSTTTETPSSTTTETPSSTTTETASSTTTELPVSSTTTEVIYSTTEVPVTSTATLSSTMQPIIVEDMPEDT